jgi:response regulator RpfG family c-di-GMP phosphodiesterase
VDTVYTHSVLIVDDEAMVGRAVAGILKKMAVGSVYVQSGEEALEKLKTASPAFSLIISDQRMQGMSGYELLEKAREISPDTVRFLITGYLDMAAIMEAVNKGAIHKYIQKPWDNREFADAIAEGLRQYEIVLENERLLRLAREQNMKLYRLNRDLKEKTEEHQRVLDGLDRELDDLNQRIAAVEKTPRHLKKRSLEELGKRLDSLGLMEKESLEGFYRAVVQELFAMFQDVAARNGFEMPGAG